uniref:Uncharacterized protein n=1 Tax=Nelumbo nucifera TaxID=4432 RepID=A0A822ZKY0_NELNU|nr:TPA_asm: hypothetical protein HUJ06_016671 [Nelumbo nucifera]
MLTIHTETGKMISPDNNRGLQNDDREKKMMILGLIVRERERERGGEMSDNGDEGR